MTAVTVDAAILLADRQCFAMLDWVAERPRDERVLRAFLASIALAALRLAEALALRVRDLGLHDEGRSGLLIHLQGQTGQAEGTDGTGVVRRVPASPELVAILKAEIVRTMASVPTTPFFYLCRWAAVARCGLSQGLEARASCGPGIPPGRLAPRQARIRPAEAAEAE